MKVFKILVLFCIFISASIAKATYTPLSAEQLKVLVPSDSRTVISLDGKWQRSYDGSNWDNVNAPNSEDFDGKIYYEKTIKISKNLLGNSAFQLYFLGIEDQVDVYFNGQFLSRYIGGMTPFYVPIPQKMVAGETNQIRLIVYPAESLIKQIKKNTIASKKIYNGLLREVILIATPKVWVSDVKYRSTIKSDFTSAKVKASIKISSSDLSFSKSIFADSSGNHLIGKVQLNASVYLVNKSTGARVAEAASKTINIESQRTINEDFYLDVVSPNLWTPDNPNLYTLKCVLSKNMSNIDDYSVDLGFRDFKFVNIENKNFLSLNGADFQIKGVTYIEDYGKSQQTLSPKRLEDDVILLKTLGANTVRIKYNAPHPYFVNLCNKYGLFILADMPVYDVPAAILGTDEVKVRIKNIAERVNFAFENSPAVLGWGLYSGADENAQATKIYAKQLSDFFKQNSSKFVYKIVNLNASNVDASNVDFIGVQDNFKNSNFTNFKEKVSSIQISIGKKPMFLSFGTPIQINNHNGYADELSLEFQAYYLRNIYYVMKERECMGSMISSLNDYKLENPIMLTNNSDQYLYSSGLVDQFRQQRLAFKTIQTLYNQEKEPLLNAGSGTDQTPASYIILSIGLAIILALMLNRFKRFKEYFIRALLRPYNFYADIRDQRIISGLQTLLLGIIISFTFGIFTSSLLYYYKTSEFAQLFLSYIVPTQSMQELVYKIIWMPEVLMIFFSLFFFIMMFLFSVLIRVLAYFLTIRLYIYDSLIITIWAGVPYIIMLPLSMVMIRILQISNGFFGLFFFLVAGLATGLWVIFRVFKSTTVVVDKLPVQIYSIGIAFFTLIIGLPLVMYQFKYSIFNYANYLFTVLIGL